MRTVASLLLLVFLLGCSTTPKKATKEKSSSSYRIVAGEMVVGCREPATHVNPAYPKEAKRRRIQGTVRLQAIITKTGELRHMKVLRGDPLLVPAALAAARQWRYAPCLLNSEPVEVVTSIDIDFKPKP